MRIVVAPDSFKGSADAATLAAAIERGIASVAPSAEVELFPMADGGEGTVETLLSSGSAMEGAARVSAHTVDALGRGIRADYLLDPRLGLAVIELAQASGLVGVSDVAPEPLRADTFGTGLLIVDALRRGAREILLCVGGSASTDGGSGIMRALGVELLDANGQDLPPGGGSLDRLEAIDIEGMDPAAFAVRWSIAVDVDNPLCGPRGAAAVYGPQKGATPADVAQLDRALSNWARVVHRDLGPVPLNATSRAGGPPDAASPCGTVLEAAPPFGTAPGLGAAGGVAVPLVAAFGAQLRPGAELVIDAIGLRDRIKGADLVVTGEGSIDQQSLRGKVIHAVGQASFAEGVPCIAIAGNVALSDRELSEAGIVAACALSEFAPEGSSQSYLMTEVVPLATSAARALIAEFLRE